MKSKTLWLSKEKAFYGYCLWTKEPEWGKTLQTYYCSGESMGKLMADFCRLDFARFCPSLKLKAGERVKIKLTNTKTGISLRKVGEVKFK